MIYTTSSTVSCMEAVARLSSFAKDVRELAETGPEIVEDNVDDSPTVARDIVSSEYEPLLDSRSDARLLEEENDTTDDVLRPRVRKLELAFTYGAVRHRPCF